MTMILGKSFHKIQMCRKTLRARHTKFARHHHSLAPASLTTFPLIKKEEWRKVTRTSGVLLLNVTQFQFSVDEILSAVVILSRTVLFRCSRMKMSRGMKRSAMKSCHKIEIPSTEWDDGKWLIRVSEAVVEWLRGGKKLEKFQNTNSWYSSKWDIKLCKI